ncbi:unnamed protein product [Acanthoscelides obtectus]|uniref:Uncharacterized protein n=1 Tax=Acanthoscelides obtectus TaxID=200917 RepID=A0A9P0PCY4_ACAOB|nr:unnamed protein product [Acanthoscelides obtectus]CAK1682023.1 hypothetical protein AOBTE_LOCUS33383 [Acanthoscelides obtectus]
MSSQEDINPDSSPDSPDAPPMSKQQEAMFEPKPTPKIIRVLTVMAYVFSVSMAAIFLSIYYIFMWEGKPHLGARVAAWNYERNLSISPPVEGAKYSRYQLIDGHHDQNNITTHIPTDLELLEYNASNNSDVDFDVRNGNSVPDNTSSTQHLGVSKSPSNKTIKKRSVLEGDPNFKYVKDIKEAGEFDNTQNMHSQDFSLYLRRI